MRDDDAQLIARVAARARPAFAALFHRRYRRLFGFVDRLTRRSEIVEEAVSDVLFTVGKDAARFDGRARTSSWILGVA